MPCTATTLHKNVHEHLNLADFRSNIVHIVQVIQPRKILRSSWVRVCGEGGPGGAVEGPQVHLHVLVDLDEQPKVASDRKYFTRKTSWVIQLLR